MAEVLPDILSWLDAKKHQAVAEIATAMAAPETAGPNLWRAVKDLAANLGLPTGQQEAGADPVENARQILGGFGVGSIHQFPGPKVPPPTYPVTELAQTPELMQKFAKGNVVPFPQEQAEANSMWDLRSNLAEAQWSVNLMKPVIQSGQASVEQIRMYNTALGRLKAAQDALPK